MDRIVTDVARAMTAAEPPGNLRAAVLARIERRPWWRLIGLASPLVLAAIVALAVVLRPGADLTMPLPASPMASLRPAVPVAAPVIVASESAAPRIVPARLAETATVRSLPALAGPQRLTAEDIQPDALAIPLLRMKPIVTEPIAMKAIDDWGGRQ